MSPLAQPSDDALSSALQATRACLPSLVRLDEAQRNALVRAMAQSLRQHSAAILASNAIDLDQATTAGQAAALIDRLRLDTARLQQLSSALDAIAELPDPLLAREPPQQRADGLLIARQPAPLGVILMVYEARPNVTADAAALCLKAGNAVLLRGGREARHSNQAIAAALHEALRGQGIDPACLRVLDDPDRSQLNQLLQRDDLIDLVIPRGGERLIRHVVEHSRIPVIQHYKGVCHLYIDRAADRSIALRLLIDGKTSRPGVCNALECVLLHRDRADELLPLIAAAMASRQVELRVSADALSRAPGAIAASEEDWGREYLDRVLALRLVDDFDAALAHIGRYGSHHTEVICSEDPLAQRRFVREVDASAVMVNASSRFNDGGELGLGAEIGISTSKLHAYGPMGLQALTCSKWVVSGQGHTRHPLNG